MKNTMLYNVPLALFGALKALLYIKPLFPNYVVNLFYHTDILLNALTGGNGTLTVSARVGFYANHKKTRCSFCKTLWRRAESLVNYTFLPMDGPNHCEQAREWALEFSIPYDGSDIEFMHGPTWSLLLLMIVITVACLFLIPILRLAAILRIF